MGRETNIAWTDHTFNPWMGCRRVSPACEHCYAEWFVTHRMGKAAWGNEPRILTTGPWREVAKWNRDAAKAGERRRVFCASLADIFEDWRGPIVNTKGRQLFHGDDGQFVTDGTPNVYPFSLPPVEMADIRRRVFKLIDSTPHLDWLLLTKRPENIARMWAPLRSSQPIFPGMPGPLGEPMPCIVTGAKRPNVWLGTTVESREYLSRLDHLLSVPAVVHFVSVEPQIEEIDLSPYLRPHCTQCGEKPATSNGKCLNCGGPIRPALGWVITGGESKQGKEHEPRSYDLAWPRSIIRQCREADVAPFVKQLGSQPVEVVQRDNNGNCWQSIKPVDLRHPKGEDPAEWPEAIRVREFPKVTQ